MASRPSVPFGSPGSIPSVFGRAGSEHQSSCYKIINSEPESGLEAFGPFRASPGSIPSVFGRAGSKHQGSVFAPESSRSLRRSFKQSCKGFRTGFGQLPPWSVGKSFKGFATKSFKGCLNNRRQSFKQSLKGFGIGNEQFTPGSVRKSFKGFGHKIL